MYLNIKIEKLPDYMLKHIIKELFQNYIYLHIRFDICLPVVRKKEHRMMFLLL
jgi:hypothetical protein